MLCCSPEYSPRVPILLTILRAKLRFGNWPTHYIAASIGDGHRMAKPLFHRDGNRNVVFSTMVGRVTVRRAFFMYGLSPLRPPRFPPIAIQHGPRPTSGENHIPV